MKTILLIEDNNEIRENFTECLELEGYKVLGASNCKMELNLPWNFYPTLLNVMY